MAGYLSAEVRQLADRKKRRLADAMGEPATIVGRGTEFRGEILGDSHLLVMGIIRGESGLECSVTLAEGATWVGSLRGIDLVIAGTVEGDIIATDRVEIRPPARIFGSVSAARIAIGEGAVIEGEIHMTGGAQPHRFEEKRHRD
jgi:cytoskeletal protein CcmA (bactofilin family)